MADYRNIITNTYSMARYNIRIIFGGKFGYFLLAAFLFFLLFGGIFAFQTEIFVEDMYTILAFPAVLLVFYPSAYGIQNDADQRTLEIIFGIPDYRYKVWLMRFLMVLVISFFLLLPFAAVAYWALMSFPIFKIVGQLMFLVFFVSTLGFALSTIVKNGNASAVIMVILGLALLILSEPLEASRWNVLLNPFNMPRDYTEFVWNGIVKQNRIFMSIASLVFILLGLLNLQNREKFLR